MKRMEGGRSECSATVPAVYEKRGFATAGGLDKSVGTFANKLSYMMSSLAKLLSCRLR